MPDGLTPAQTSRSTYTVAALQGLVTVATFAAVGALCGLLWFHLWQVPPGVVSDGEWFTDETGLRGDFAGTGLYVAIAALAGLVLGALAAWFLDRAELVTLVAVAAGSVLAAYLMLRVGYHLSPPDPQVVARTAEDGARVDGALRVHQWPPRLAFPFGALVGLVAVYSLTGGRTPPGWTGAAASGTPDGTHGEAPGV